MTDSLFDALAAGLPEDERLAVVGAVQRSQRRERKLAEQGDPPGPTFRPRRARNGGAAPPTVVDGYRPQAVSEDELDRASTAPWRGE